MKSITYLISILLISYFHCLAQETAKPLPADAVALKKSYEQAQQKALDPLRAKYIAELQKLLEAHTKAGNLDGALVIREEMKHLSLQTTQDKDPKITETPTNLTAKKQDLENYLINSTWSVYKKDQLMWKWTFSAEKKVFVTGRDRPWAVSEDEKLIIDNVYIANFSKDMKSFTINWGESGEFVCKLVEKP